MKMQLKLLRCLQEEIKYLADIEAIMDLPLEQEI